MTPEMKKWAKFIVEMQSNKSRCKSRKQKCRFAKKRTK